jgi:hypothetical protein
VESIDPGTFKSYNSNKSIDFEIAFTALITTLVTVVPSNLVGVLATIPIIFSIGLLVITLVRKMIVMSEEGGDYLKITSYLLNTFSLIPIVYILYNLSMITNEFLFISISPIALTAGLITLIVLETVGFHILVTKDFADFLFFSTIYRKKESNNTKIGKKLGNKSERLVRTLIRQNIPKKYCSQLIRSQIEVNDSLDDFPPFKQFSSKILTLSFMIVAFFQLLTLSPLLTLISYSISVVMILALLIPLQVWYLNYGVSTLETIFDLRYYLAMALPGIIYFLVIY